MDYRLVNREGLSISLPSIFPKTVHFDQVGHGVKATAVLQSMDLILWLILQFRWVRIQSCMPLVAGTSGIQMHMLFHAIVLIWITDLYLVYIQMVLHRI